MCRVALTDWIGGTPHGQAAGIGGVWGIFGNPRNRNRGSRLRNSQMRNQNRAGRRLTCSHPPHVLALQARCRPSFFGSNRALGRASLPRSCRGARHRCPCPFPAHAAPPRPDRVAKPPSPSDANIVPAKELLRSAQLAREQTAAIATSRLGAVLVVAVGEKVPASRQRIADAGVLEPPHGQLSEVTASADARAALRATTCAPSLRRRSRAAAGRPTASSALRVGRATAAYAVARCRRSGEPCRRGTGPPRQHRRAGL